jgi:hypothetical protein
MDGADITVHGCLLTIICKLNIEKSLKSYLVTVKCYAERVEISKEKWLLIKRICYLKR